MDVIHFPEAQRPRWRTPVVALGNFDGVHRGHMKLLERVRRQAGERGGSPVVVTFDPHPPRVLRPDKAPPLLMTLDQRLEAFDRAGMQAVAIVRFTPELAQWHPEVFVDTVLVDWLGAAEVWVGANFLFGRDRAGTYTVLKTLGGDRGFRAEHIEPVRYKEFVVSSSRIRRLIEEGRVDEAATPLGHQYFIDGTVVHGDGRGRALGVATANLATENELVPGYGVYATLAILDGLAWPAVTSVGVRPTIGDGRFTIETHLLDRDTDLYGQRLRVAFIQRLRGEVRFDSLDALKVQMQDDCRHAAEMFRQISL
jgi:riboflavin kinase/FMN adenylyltransferase